MLQNFFVNMNIQSLERGQKVYREIYVYVLKVHCIPPSAPAQRNVSFTNYGHGYLGSNVIESFFSAKLFRGQEDFLLGLKFQKL